MRWLAAALVLLATGAAADPPSVLDLRVVDGGGTKPLREIVGDAPAVVAFWATWCAPCRTEVPALNRALTTWRDRGLKVIGVSLDGEAARVDEARERWGMRYDLRRLAPEDTARAESLFSRGLPVTAFVVRGKPALHERLLDDATLDRRVPELLAAPAAQ